MSDDDYDGWYYTCHRCGKDGLREDEYRNHINLGCSEETRSDQSTVKVA